MGIWVVGTLNQLFIKGFYTEIQFSKKNKVLSLKSTSDQFALSLLFVLTLAFDRIVLYRNMAFSKAVKAVLGFQKFLSKVVAMETFQNLQ